MRVSRSILFSSAAIALANPVLAGPDDTAILVEYFGMLSDSGMEYEVGTMEEAGKYSQWNNITFGNDELGFTSEIPWIRVTSGLLGGQTITVAETMTADIEGDVELDLPPMKLEISAKDYEIKVTGKAGARGYDFNAGEMTFRTVGEGPLNMDGTLRGMNGTYALEGGKEVRAIGTFGMETANISYEIEEEGVTVKAEIDVSNMLGEMDAPLALSVDPMTFMANLNADTSLLYDYRIGEMSSKMNMMLDGHTIQDMTTTGQSGTGRIRLHEGFALLSGTSNDISYDIGPSLMTGMPAMSAKIVSADTNISIPLENIDLAKPANVKLALNDMTLSDAAWGMFDPAGHLPRDAVNLNIDLSGNMIWDRKIADIDPETMDSAPVLLENVTINALNLKAVGAELTTSGALTLNNDIFPPVPAGDVEVSIKGGNALVDNLVAAGIIPAEQAMMAKGMSMMFFTAGGDGADHLVSKLKMTADGHISANGMPLK